MHWGAIFGGAAIAVAIGWIGELFGGLFTLFRPGTSGVWSWLGGLLNVIFWAGGAFVGAFVASRVANRATRAGGLLDGLVVWGLIGAFAALVFSLLGGNVALLAGATAGGARLSLGVGIVSLMGAFIAAMLGGLAGQTESLRMAREEQPPTPGGPERAHIVRPGEPTEEERPPPSLH